MFPVHDATLLRQLIDDRQESLRRAARTGRLRREARRRRRFADRAGPHNSPGN